MSRHAARPSAAAESGRAGLWWAAIAAVALLATLLHLYRLDAKSIWWDESLSLYRAQRSLSFILSNHIDFPGAESIDLHPPLYFIILHAFVRLWGESDVVLRLPSVLAATLSVPLLYLLGQELRNRRSGLLAALFGALSPFYLWYAQEARMYTMVTMLGLLAALCLWRFLACHSWRWGLAFWAVSALGVASHYLYVLVIVGQLLAAPIMLGRGKTAELLGRLWHKRGLRWAVLILLLVTGLLVATLGRTAWMQVIGPQDGRKYVSLPLMLRDAFNSYSLGLTVSVVEVWPLVALFSLTYLAGLLALALTPDRAPRVRAGAVLLLGGYALSLPVGMWLYSLVRSLYMGSRYVIMGSPAFYLGVAVGVDWLWGRRVAPRWRRQALAWILLLTLCGSMLYSDARYFYHERYTTKEDHRGTAEYVAAREQPGDLIIVTAPENLPAFEHYYRGSLPIVGMPTIALHPTFDPRDLARDLEAAIVGYERVWLVQCRVQHSDPEEQVMGWLRDHTVLISHRRFPSWGSTPEVDLYRTAPNVQVEAVASDAPLALFGETLALEGVTLYGRSASDLAGLSVAPATSREASLPLSWPVALTSGTQLTGELTWITRQDIDNLKTALRLRDERGLVWAQRDRPIIELIGSHAYGQGTRLIQDASLVLPVGLPPARYRLELVVYQAETGANLALADGGAVLPLAEVQIMPPGELDTWAAVDEDDFQRLPQRPVLGATDLVAAKVAPTQLAPGGEASLALYWQARASGGDDATLVINWQDTQGNIWHHQSAPLAGLDYPRSAWRKGELVMGLIALPVPANAPPGEHTLHLLVHDAAADRFVWARLFGLLPTGRDVTLATLVIE